MYVCVHCLYRETCSPSQVTESSAAAALNDDIPVSDSLDTAGRGRSDAKTAGRRSSSSPTPGSLSLLPADLPLHRGHDSAVVLGTSDDVHSDCSSQDSDTSSTATSTRLLDQPHPACPDHTRRANCAAVYYGAAHAGLAACTSAAVQLGGLVDADQRHRRQHQRHHHSEEEMFPRHLSLNLTTYRRHTDEQSALVESELYYSH